MNVATEAAAVDAVRSRGAAVRYQTVTVSGLERAYDEHYALIDLTTTFYSGAVTVVLGPNGAGKSTLLGILSTRMRPTEGTLAFGDRQVDRVPPDLRMTVGYVGHQPMLYADLSARENLTFFGRLFRVAGLAERVDGLLDHVGLRRDKDRPVSGFSRGMTQRLSLARAILHEPTLLLLDEPFSGLDPQGVIAALEILSAERDRGAIIVLVTHDLDAAGELADRALVLRRGRAVFDGPVTGDLTALYRDRVGVAAGGNANRGNATGGKTR